MDCFRLRLNGGRSFRFLVNAALVFTPPGKCDTSLLNGSNKIRNPPPAPHDIILYLNCQLAFEWARSCNITARGIFFYSTFLSVAWMYLFCFFKAEMRYSQNVPRGSQNRNLTHTVRHSINVRLTFTEFIFYFGVSWDWENKVFLWVFF